MSLQQKFKEFNTYKTQLIEDTKDDIKPIISFLSDIDYGTKRVENSCIEVFEKAKTNTLKENKFTRKLLQEQDIAKLGIYLEWNHNKWFRDMVKTIEHLYEYDEDSLAIDDLYPNHLSVIPALPQVYDAAVLFYEATNSRSKKRIDEALTEVSKVVMECIIHHLGLSESETYIKSANKV